MATHEVVRINPEAKTVLIGSDAEVIGGIRIAWTRPGTRGFWDGWTRPGEGFIWRVNVPRAADYELTVMAEGGRGRPMVEAIAGGKTLRRRLRPYWDRIALGKVRLPGGAGRLILRSVGKRRISRFLGLELIRPSVRKALRQQADGLKADTSWIIPRVHGLMFHWVDGIYPRHGPSKPYQQAVQDFNLQAFVKQVGATGAGWVYLTTTHVKQHWPGPNAAMDRVLPGRTCKRDLIGEMAEALEDRGVRLGLYYHLGHEDKDWWGRAGWDRVGKTAFYRTWCDVVRDAGRRYGEHVFGWWFDDGIFSYYPINPPWARLLRAARAGYAQRLICWNAWNAAKATDFADMSTWDSYLTDELISGGGNLPRGGGGRFIAGPQEGLQAHITTLLQDGWGHGVAETPIGKCRYSAKQLIAWLKEAKERRAVVTLNPAIYQDGTFSQADVRLLRQAHKAVKPGR